MRRICLIAIVLALSLCTVAYCAGSEGGAMGDYYAAPVQPPLSGAPGPLSGTVLYGVDISVYQGTIDWDALNAAKDFAIMRSSYGVGYTDGKLSRNQSEARRVGILRGYYHFAYPNYGNAAVDEANWMLSAIGTLQTGEILCLDYEVSYSQPVTWCLAFLNRVYSVTGVKPFLYMNFSTLNAHDWSPVKNAGYPLWLAYWDYNSNPATPTTSWGFTAIKQYSDSGNVAGLNPVDLDSFNGDASAFMAYGMSGSPDTTPPVISNVQATSINSSGATITWTTDDPSTSRVDYGLTSSYGSSTTEDMNYVTNHSVGLSGLSANTPYHYRVKSTNGVSLTSYSGDYTFTTSAALPGQPTVAAVNSTSLNVANNAGDSASGYYAFRINDGGTCSNKFVQSNGTVGTSPVWQTKTAWGTRTVTSLTSNAGYIFDVAGASDSSGSNATYNRYGGAYVNTPTLGVANKWGSGDTAATFNGSNEYVSLPAMGTEVDLSSGFTIECWANPSALSTWYPVIQLTDSSNYSTFVNHICFNMTGTGGMRADIYQSGGCGSPCMGNYYWSPSLSFTTGSWHHYAMVVSSGGTLTFYKDGAADAGQSLLYMPSGGVTRGKVQIGRRDTSSTYYWHGSLDEVAVYDYALSSSRINAHRNAADAALYNTEVVKDDPVAYWRLGETSGTAAADNKGGYGASSQAKYTLAKAGESTDGTGSTGNVYCTTASKNSWYTTGKTFTFSNPAGFGTDGTWKASSFQYKWNKSSTESWSGSGTAWSAGTISLTANQGEGEYYLHVRAFNADGAANNADVLDYGPFGSDVSPPSDVTPTDEGSYTPSQDTLKASWTASTDTGGSGILRYEYAVGTSSTTQDVRGWVSNSLSTSVTISGLSLVDGQTYYIQVRAKDNAGNFSATNPTDGILVAPGVTPIASAWVKANDTEPLSLRDKIVTAHIGDAFWLEETDRTCAIKVVSSASVTRGETVSVAGVLQFDGAQRYLLGDVVVNLGGSSVIQPLGVTCAWLGGGNYNASTPGITGGFGQYNIGMLVRCWGKVTYSNTSDPNNKYFYLDDGSGLASDGHDGVKVWCGTVNPPTSGTVIVTGVVTSESIGGNIVPVLMVRDGAEILTL